MRAQGKSEGKGTEDGERDGGIRGSRVKQLEQGCAEKCNGACPVDGASYGGNFGHLGGAEVRQRIGRDGDACLLEGGYLFSKKVTAGTTIITTVTAALTPLRAIVPVANWLKATVSGLSSSLKI